MSELASSSLSHIALGFYGLITALMFFFFQAPDVALSQITVGAVALPPLPTDRTWSSRGRN
jgi:uncharacterized MnhB-related membrane protein